MIPKIKACSLTVENQYFLLVGSAFKSPSFSKGEAKQKCIYDFEKGMKNTDFKEADVYFSELYCHCCYTNGSGGIFLHLSVFIHDLYMIDKFRAKAYLKPTFQSEKRHFVGCFINIT